MKEIITNVTLSSPMSPQGQLGAVHENRVLVFAPNRLEQTALQETLAEGGFQSHRCDSATDLAHEIHRGCGMALVSSDALGLKETQILLDAVSRQDRWSDLPLVLLTDRDTVQEWEPAAWHSLIGEKAAGNVTILERPFHSRALLSAVRAALRARRRQYEIRDNLEEWTSSQEHRRRLAVLVESSYDAIIGKTLDGMITSWNAGAERLYGFTAEEAVGRPISIIIPRSRHGEVRRILDDLKGGKRVEHLETVRITKSGEERFVSLIISPVKDDHGRPIAAVTVARDITDRKHAEDQLRALNETLEQRVAERTAEAEYRAAQLRALAAELTDTEQRERRRLAQTLHDHLQQLLVAARLKLGPLRRRADSALRRGLDQVDNLMVEAVDASRSLTIELSPPVLYDGGLVAAFEWLGRHMLEKHGLEISIRTEVGVEPDAEGIRLLLFQVVRELLFNVVKHGRTDHASVDLRRTDNGLIKVVVRDEGAGFDAARISGRETTDGFGLFGIRERLEPLGGSMEIESAPGRGTRITIHIPVTQVAAIALQDEALPYHDHAGGVLHDDDRPATNSGRVRVLLADDHEILREGLASLLWEEPDIELVGQAGDGLAAVEMALRTRPDVVLMDITMPRMNGIDATRRITTELPGVRVIGLSMHEKQDMAEAMREAGAEAYLPKGGSSETLIAAIRGISHVAV